MSFERDTDPAAVAASRSGARWSVAAGDWQDLPPEVVELLAAPVEVHVDGVPEDEDGEPGYPAPDEPCASVRQGYGECMPAFLAPARVDRELTVAGPWARRARHRI